MATIHNLLPLRDGGVENHLPFLVMDFPPRGTLREYHPQGRQLPLLTVILSVTSLAAALQYLHERQVAHHNLNPDEVWVGNHHQLLLSEPLTHLERSFRSRDELIDYVLPDEVLSREIAYLAPECIQGRPGSCEAADQYALAIMAYEWLCGERLCKGSWAEIAVQQLHASPPPLHQKVLTVPPDVEEVVLIALEKDPQKRFAGVQAFVTALGQAASPGGRISSSVEREEGAMQGSTLEQLQQQGQVYELHNSVVTIGRYRDNDIVLADRLVARRHARLIRLEDGTYGIEDLHWPTGIMVNGRGLNVSEIRPLQDGDRIQIGQTVLVFRSSRR